MYNIIVRDWRTIIEERRQPSYYYEHIYNLFGTENNTSKYTSDGSHKLGPNNRTICKKKFNNIHIKCTFVSNVCLWWGQENKPVETENSCRSTGCTYGCRALCSMWEKGKIRKKRADGRSDDMDPCRALHKGIEQVVVTRRTSITRDLVDPLIYERREDE